jgi:hypothetical protein
MHELSEYSFQVKLHDGAPAIAYRIGSSVATSCAENEIRVRGTAKNNIERNHRLELVGYLFLSWRISLYGL